MSIVFDTIVMALPLISPMAPATPNAIADASFEAVKVPDGKQQYVYAPSDPGGWTFSGDAAVSRVGPQGFNTHAVDGTQNAMLQSIAGSAPGRISQMLTLTPGSDYVVSYYAATRNGIYGNAYPGAAVTVTLGGVDLGTFTPDRSGEFSLVTSHLGRATQTSELLSFSVPFPSGGVDRDTVIDAVRITEVPEPASLALMATALGLLAFRTRRVGG